MSAEERHRLRATFDEDAELYRRARPVYPEQLFDELTELASLRPGDRVLEIGCGTGQATHPLARRGFDVVCVELGPELAAVARRELAGFPNVEVLNAAFEPWEPARAGFVAVVAFTAFHWLDPESRHAKTARLLRDCGSLAIVETQHVLPEDGDAFFVEVQEDYDAIWPDDENRPPPRPEEVADLRTELAGSDLFGEIAVRRYLWDVVYTADQYVDVLSTYSGHRALDQARREQLLERIRRRVEQRPGSRVRKTYLATLHVARRRDAAQQVASS